MINTIIYRLTLLIIVITAFSCSKEDELVAEPIPNGLPTPYVLKIPTGFPQPFLPADNPLTFQGVELGRRLFFDPILSADSSQACVDCHDPASSFVDPNTQFSLGIDGNPGDRNSMPLFNLAWNINNSFFWDGRSKGMEIQALEPIINPVEMHNTWHKAIADLQAHPSYPSLFEAAFQTTTIDSLLVTKALAQFERTLVSGNSKFDKFLRGEVALTASELSGMSIFETEKTDCFHCHGSPTNILWTDNEFRNNGLDATFTDLGLGAVTGDPNDNGKFRVPSLRNLSYTSPYMHDGRFATLDEVIDHYSEGLKNSPTIDPFMKKVAVGGVRLSPLDKADLKAFLLTLNDQDFVTNPDFQTPFK